MPSGSCRLRQRPLRQFQPTADLQHRRSSIEIATLLIKNNALGSAPAQEAASGVSSSPGHALLLGAGVHLFSPCLALPPCPLCRECVLQFNCMRLIKLFQCFTDARPALSAVVGPSSCHCSTVATTPTVAKHCTAHNSRRHLHCGVLACVCTAGTPWHRLPSPCRAAWMS